ncbi:MAG: ArsA family ATPase [Candidatus Hodarchaeota archaeon]
MAEMRSPELIFFGGKGGVGKSTTSAATATFLAKLKPDKKILLISFDMAHNLSDIFSLEIGDKITQILDNLWAIEPDAERYTEEFTKEFVEKARALVKTIPLVKQLSNLDEYIDETYSAASIPLAVKNSIFFEEIITKSQDYDIFVIDMPPTGNMISIFEVPKTSIQVLLKNTLETIDKVRKFVKTLKNLNPANWFRSTNEKRKNLAKDLLEMLRELDRRGDKIIKLLKENSSLRFVSIPERPSFEEIKRASAIVEKYVKLDGVVINKIIQHDNGCPHCNMESINQKKYIKLIEDEFKGKKIWKGYKFDEEALGIEKMIEFAEIIYEGQDFDEILHPN